MKQPIDQLLTTLAVVRKYRSITIEMFPELADGPRESILRRLLYGLW